MTHSLAIDVVCVLGTSGLVAVIELEGGGRQVVPLNRGMARVELTAQPLRVRLDAEHSGHAVSWGDDPARGTSADAEAVSIVEAFGAGVAVSGPRLNLQLVWDGRCHGEQHVPDDEGRFGSWEHIQTAWYVGRTAVSVNAPQLQGPVTITYDTPLPLDDTTATFGEIICLAGDFYAHLDDESAAMFADVWPPLSGLVGWVGGDYRAARLRTDSGSKVRALLETIHAEGGEKRGVVSEFARTAVNTTAHHYPLRRYLALASQNYCHFGSPDPSRVPDEALAAYRSYHGLALRRAAEARADKVAWLNAVITEAFACHFLTDLFASGHMRVPRRALSERFGVVKGALSMSGGMHDEDNHLGLWCRSRHEDHSKQVVWRAFGDGRLLSDAADLHLRQVQEAVRRSVAEIFEANRGGAPNLPGHDERAEALIPQPLPPGVAPTPHDRRPDDEPFASGELPNHWPRFVLMSNGHIGERVGGPEISDYADLEAPQR
jgi:hypothetical protein